MNSAADAVVLKYLHDRNLSDIATAFAKATSQSSDHDLSATPSLSRLLELWQATHGHSAPFDYSLSGLDISTSLVIPDRPTTTLYESQVLTFEQD